MGLGRLYDAGSCALPAHGTDGGAGLQLVNAVREARPAAQALRGDLQPASATAWRRHANTMRQNHTYNYDQPVRQAVNAPSHTDQLDGPPAYTESDRGAVDRC